MEAFKIYNTSPEVVYRQVGFYFALTEPEARKALLGLTVHSPIFMQNCPL